VLSGEYRSAAGARPTLNRPALIYNPAGTTHRDHFEHGRGSFYSISLDPTRARQVLQGVALPQEPRYLERAEQQGLAVSIAGLCAQQRADLSLEALALELLGSMDERTAATAGMPPWMPLALELLHDRYAADLSVAEVAATVGVHPIHLARTFRRHFRCTPGAFTRFRRLEKAVGLLSATTSPLTEIALSCGFADQSHLTHAFARWLGASPARYRALTAGHDHRASPGLQFDKTAATRWSKLGELAASARYSARKGR
jgi:AraC family transcriptional regulator